MLLFIKRNAYFLKFLKWYIYMHFPWYYPSYIYIQKRVITNEKEVVWFISSFSVYFKLGFFFFVLGNFNKCKWRIFCFSKMAILKTPSLTLSVMCSFCQEPRNWWYCVLFHFLILAWRTISAIDLSSHKLVM